MTDVLSWIRSPGPLLIGHRGRRGPAPENTPAAFEGALEAGCDGVEFDVRATRDGVLVVHHDETARTEVGRVEIATTAWDDLRERRLVAAGVPYRIPLLSAVLETLQRRALVNVEVKPPDPARRGEVASLVAAALGGVRPRESVLVSSFDPAFLEALRAADPSLLLGLLFSDARVFSEVEQTELVESLTALHPRHDRLDRKLAKRAAERGLWTAVWTVNDPKEAGRVVGLGARAVITDEPSRVEASLWNDTR